MTFRSSATIALAALALSTCHPKPHTVHPSTVARSSVDDLRHDIDAILAAPALAQGFWGVSIKSTSTGDVLYQLNARKLMMPASTMKIVTLAAAADILGWDFTYETRLAAAGRIDAGTLDGDLLVVGSGDPSIDDWDGAATKLFASWTDELKARGISTITGRIVGDDKAFGDEALGFGWSWDDLSAAYAAGVSALQFNESSVRVTITPGLGLGDSASVVLSPSASGLMVSNRIATSAPNTAASIQRRRLPGSSRLELRGSIPAGSAAIVQLVSVDNPTLFFVTALREALIAHGIDVRGPPVVIDDLPVAPPTSGEPTLATHRSPPLSALAPTLMKLSQNQFAETFLKTIGGAAGTPTSDGGRAAVRAMLQRWSVSPAVIQADGSGLSRYNYIAADALVDLLRHIASDERLRGPFQASLPIAGRDGTLETRLKGTAAEGNAMMKTGSMTGVRAAAGYVRTADGDEAAFAILANNFDASPSLVTQAADSIVVRVAQFTR